MQVQMHRGHNRTPSKIFRGSSWFLYYSLSICFFQAAFVSLRAQTQELILPVVATGQLDDFRHYESTFTFLNPSGSSVQVNLYVYDSKGTQVSAFCMPVPGSFQTTLNPNGTFHVAALAGGILFAGWARATWEGNAEIQAQTEIDIVRALPVPCDISCARASIELLASAQVAAVKAAKEFRLSATATSNRQTAIALVNPSNTQPADVELTVLDSSGKTFFKYQVQIPPRVRIARLLRQFFECGLGPGACPPILELPNTFHGSVQITSVVPVSVGALDVLFPEGKLVNNPVSSFVSP